MRPNVGLLTSLALACWSQTFANGWSAEPTATTPAPTSAAPASATAASTTQPTSTSATPDAGKAAKLAKPELTPQDKQLIAQGFQLEMHGDRKYFCRRETPVGSHLSKKFCSTKEELAANKADAKAATDDLQRQGFRPSVPQTGGAGK